MANVNRVMIIGRLTRNPEVTYTPKGTPVTSLGLAVNRSYKADDGTRQEETTFVEVQLWARTAEVAAQYLTKGAEVYIEGRLAQESWTDKQSGQKRSKTKDGAESMQMLSGRHENAPSGPARPAGPNQRRAEAPMESETEIPY
jgi:single-strand DNA-binding protein